MSKSITVSMGGYQKMSRWEGEGGGASGRSGRGVIDRNRSTVTPQGSHYIRGGGGYYGCNIDRGGSPWCPPMIWHVRYIYLLTQHTLHVCTGGF